MLTDDEVWAIRMRYRAAMESLRLGPMCAAIQDIPPLLRERDFLIADRDTLLTENTKLRSGASVWRQLSSLYQNGYGCDCPSGNDAEALPAIVAAIKKGDFAAASQLLEEARRKEIAI